jgi:hypothetical protein
MVSGKGGGRWVREGEEEVGEKEESEGKTGGVEKVREGSWGGQLLSGACRKTGRGTHGVEGVV